MALRPGKMPGRPTGWKPVLLSTRIDHQHRGVVELAGAKSIQRCVGLFQGECFRLRSHRDARRDLEKLFAVATRQVRDRSDDPFFPKIGIWKRWDVAHVNPATNYNAAFGESA